MSNLPGAGAGEAGAQWRPALEPALLVASIFLGNALLSPLLDILVRARFGLDNTRTSAFMIVNQAAQLLCGFAMGWLADHFRVQRALTALGLLGGGVCLAAMPFIPTFNALLCLRVIEGVCTIGVVSLMFARGFAATAAPAQRGRNLACISAAIPAAYMLGPTIIAIFGDTHFQLILALAGAVQCTGGLWVLLDGLAGADEAQSSAIPKPAQLPLHMNRNLAWAMVFSFADKMSFAAFAMLPSLMFKDMGNADPARSAGRMMLTFWIGYLLCVRLSHPMTRRYGAAWPLALTSLGYGVLLVLMGWMGQGGMYLLMLPLGAVAALKFAPQLTLAAEGAAPERRASVMALLNMAGSIGMLFGFAVAGILSKRGYYVSVWVTMGAFEFAWALLWLLCHSTLRPTTPHFVQAISKKEVIHGNASQ